SWDARQAEEFGIVQEVVPDEEVDLRGIALAHEFAAGPAEVMGLSKMIMLKSFESSLAEMMDYEDLAQSLAQSSVEFREGLGALTQKRKPDFLGAVRASPIEDGLPSESDDPAPG